MAKRVVIIGAGISAGNHVGRHVVQLLRHTHGRRFEESVP